VRPSACNDEIVVYLITPMKAADSLAVDARKIVRGEEQGMGVLACRLMPLSGQLTCTIPQGVWRFRVHNDSLTGELRTLDNTRYREVRAVRAP
jgi:subtilisin-like proprotein convertase family protein